MAKQGSNTMVDNYDSPGSSSVLTDEQVEIAQWRVQVTEDGDWKINDIYGEYWEEQENKKVFAKHFKAAVDDGRVSGLKVIRHPDGSDKLSSDRQTVYRIEKNPRAGER
ncbi:hypothetical protein [Sphingomonas radiodurans]|uniref:hypothetical protein n=1 Tax=Sphingomonas radiodurans TaxID=2890321 RepID=UPI001E341E9B|nr:hypothetical protein [Sphingomonas radiodurans]WBH15283.1 hypothetical protein LLW23_10530 [Sphingomonas radiodurans]